MFLLLDTQIGDQETNQWLTALIDDHISNLERKMEDYFPTSGISGKNGTFFSLDSAAFYC